ncbi:UDP-N-acetylmuramoyl-L-alanine--D-glutamate ligase [Tenggerimyces flavus]|uniref:UDP-N-acetylmuramoylalanine--D-glutamate ligase n=1 Tax=Tenggerimyces flavus TaxID=1708749 RepID=A0ABV7Y3M5_9ACTN|nr:UDP-N-acetylmuramoyl-L-alanine--D-glutamate ligase [Tenggerimyces flavus]MBM7788587.1 UDP-N-acetylmuramoylalanine--D-glutamate ligase [Tenggerimyces flavus]
MTALSWLDGAHQRSPWDEVSAVVAGFGVSGYSAAAGLLHVGAHVTVLSDGEPDDAARERATILETLGADIRLGEGATESLPDKTNVLVVSPGLPQQHRLAVAARSRSLPILGEVDLAWRLRSPERPAPWIGLTGTNGKTTTVQMLTSILRAAGLRTAAVGNIGDPIVDAVMDPTPYDVLAVELSNFQLWWSPGLHLRSAAVLNVAPDHLEWHPTMDEYTRTKGKIYDGCEVACVYNVEDPVTEQLVRDADVVEGCRAIGITVGVPGVSMLGIVDDVLADRAFIEERQTAAAELATLSDLPSLAPHNIANALAAAALARSFGVPTVAVRDGLRGFQLDKHRIEQVAVSEGVTYIDDSKATNTHAAQASLLAFSNVVWIAGGQAKGQSFDELVRVAKDRLRGVVLLGVDRGVIADALARLAPSVPVIDVGTPESGVMDHVVLAAGRLARSGDTVLLAPGCASKDQFPSYGARGDAFAAAVHRLG